MQSNNYVDAKDILHVTNGGLDIIFMLYPQAIGSDTQKTRKFKIHEEKTASASLKQADDGNWIVTNFGDDSIPRNGILCFAKERGLAFVPALQELAVMFNVISEAQAVELVKAEYSDRQADETDLEGTWSFEIRDKSAFTTAEVEQIGSKKVLYKLGWDSKDDKERAAANQKIHETFQEYRWHPLVSYSMVKNRKVMTWTSNDQYPMFLIDEKSHQKIYQPKHPDKGRRFMYSGEKPKDFIHGLTQLNQAFEARKKLIDEEKNEDAEDDDRNNGKSSADKKKAKEAKLPEVILCTGGSDAINVALLGYRVLWLNSETAKLQQYQYDRISIMVEKVYLLPDIDTTGKRAAHELNMLYLDMYCIELPEDLKKHRDRRGHECKDVRDYLDHYKIKEFKKLVDVALPYRFWEKTPQWEGKGESREFVGYKYEFKGIPAFNFLYKNGFGKLALGEGKSEWIFIRQVGNIVYETDGDQIQDFIHYFLKERQQDIALRESIQYTSKLNNAALTRLEFRNIDFTDNTKDSQFIFFTNYTLEVKADDIVYHKPGALNRFIWEKDVLQHHVVKPEKEPFTITKDEFGVHDIEINDTVCPFLQYLVQTSRVHWREELEVRMPGLTPVEQEAYLKAYKCTIAGPNLKPAEIEEQKQHLINKIFTIGFLLHRFKARNKGWFVWAQDNKINDDGKSHGGSGKSILFDMGIRAMLKKSMTLNGRNSKLNDDNFKYDGVTEHTRYLLVDDAHEYLKLDPFYKDISGDLNVNPKGKTPFVVPFEKSAKVAFTSNYTPRDLGPSTERRMVYTAFSDYYHNKGETDDYKEKRDPTTDLGMTLFTDFKPAQWNSFYQVMLHCLKFYLGTTDKIGPAMGNVNKRNLLAEMGNFYEWALVYFSEDAERLDRFFVREEFQKDYLRFNGKIVTPQTVMGRLKAFCRYRGYVLNPKEYLNKDGKIIKKAEPKIFHESSGEWQVIPNAAKTTKEHFYIQTKNELAPHDDDHSPPAAAPAGEITADANSTKLSF